MYVFLCACIYVFIYVLTTTVYEIVMCQRHSHQMGDFLCIARRRSHGDGGPSSSYKAQSGDPSGENALRWTRPGRGKGLFRNLPLAAGHPLTRIRVFNSACEENEEEKRMWSKEGCRNENGGDRTRTANWLDRHVFVDWMLSANKNICHQQYIQWDDNFGLEIFDIKIIMFSISDVSERPIFTSSSIIMYVREKLLMIILLTFRFIFSFLSFHSEYLFASKYISSEIKALKIEFNCSRGSMKFFYIRFSLLFYNEML